jgi:iron complex outermembrane receptor protein
MKARSLMGVSTLALMISGLPQAVFAAAAAGPAVNDSGDTIIVTGTRDVGVTALESPTPIQVVGADTLAATGQNNVFDALKDILPSFSSSATNFDTSAMIRSARLRGMSPGEVLVLINGKRRHQSANVNADTGTPDTGSNPTDLDQIPISMIDHVEVLMDGAAAQYGSDAVAGVINIILKGSNHGTDLALGGGLTSRGDGGQANFDASQGFALGSDGYVTIGLDYRRQNIMERGGYDCRTEPNNPVAVANCAATGSGSALPSQYGGHPVRNPILGLGQADVYTGGFNAEKPITDNITVYAFGTGGYKKAAAFENDRLGNFFSYPDPAMNTTPQGFDPQETVSEVDGAVTGGIKGEIAKWSWDASLTWGRDDDEIGVQHTVNPSMVENFGYSPSSFHSGAEINTQVTGNLDIRRSFDTGYLGGPLNVAFGAEYRYDNYAVQAGDFGSTYQDGPSSYFGFMSSDASNTSRDVMAEYIDLSQKLLTNWTVDLAGRFERDDSTGVGDTFNKKLTTRYDVIPQLGIRGTISDGFHAPTLAQSAFSQAAVGPNSLGGQNYYFQLPVRQAGGLGAVALKPEKSKDVDFGIVAEPLPKWHITADAYQIILNGRILDTGLFSGAAVDSSLAAAGLTIASNNKYFADYFFNGANTRTRGLDITSDYKTDFGRYGSVKWTLAANFNATAIIGGNLNPGGALSAANVAADATAITKTTPSNKISLAPNWVIGDFDVTLRETRYGHVDTNAASSAYSSRNPYANIFIKSAYITDLDIGYSLTDNVKWSVGGNNILDVMPSKLPQKDLSFRAAETYPAATPWGISGAYFYSRITASF